MLLLIKTPIRQRCMLDVADVRKRVSRHSKLHMGSHGEDSLQARAGATCVYQVRTTSKAKANLLQ
jgi:hypothetical protein